MHFQSENFVPFVSGWKIDSETGRFEMNRVTERGGVMTVNGRGIDVLYSGGKSKSESKSGFDEAMAKGAQAVLDYMAGQISETAIVREEISARCEDGGKEQIIPIQRKSGDAKPFMVIDGTIYINNALVGAVFSSKEASASPEQKPPLEKQILEVLKNQLRPGGLLWRSGLGR